MDEDAAQVDEVLERMHREPRPGSEVVVAVVQGVGDAIERMPVKQAMDEEKVGRVKNGIATKPRRNKTGWALGSR